jgi:hypothetical protein
MFDPKKHTTLEEAYAAGVRDAQAADEDSATSFEGEPQTMEDISRMAAEDINAHWDKVQQILSEQGAA